MTSLVPVNFSSTSTNLQVATRRRRVYEMMYMKCLAPCLAWRKCSVSNSWPQGFFYLFKELKKKL